MTWAGLRLLTSEKSTNHPHPHEGPEKTKKSGPPKKEKYNKKTMVLSLHEIQGNIPTWPCPPFKYNMIQRCATSTMQLVSVPTLPLPLQHSPTFPSLPLAPPSQYGILSMQVCRSSCSHPMAHDGDFYYNGCGVPWRFPKHHFCNVEWDQNQFVCFLCDLSVLYHSLSLS